MNDRRYPFEDLARAMGLTPNAAGKRLNVGGSTYVEYRDRGMSVRVADRLAAKVGFHPAEVWPSWFDDALEDLGKPCAECSELFLPSRKGNIYCRPVCRSAATVRRYRATPRGAEVRRKLAKAHYDQCSEYIRKQRRARWDADIDESRRRKAELRAQIPEDVRRAQRRASYLRHRDRILAEKKARYWAERAA